MASLCDLPDEILLEIVRHLDAIRSFENQSEAFKDVKREKGRQLENHVRQQTLYALCLTSHRFRYLSLPTLYSSSVTCAIRRGYRQLHLLHRTIGDPNTRGQIEPLTNHVRYIENRLADFRGNSLSDDESFQHTLLAAYFQKLADLVLCAPNLEHICIVSVEHENVSFWTRILSQASRSQQQVFAKLKHLSAQIHAYHHTSAPEVSQFERILQHARLLPLLSDLRISGAVTSVNADLASGVGEIANLYRLELTECNLGMKNVADLLLVCRNLQHFSCKWQWVDHDQTSPFVFRSTFRSLQGCTATLVTLTLDWREIWQIPPIASELEMIGSLRHLKSLRSLEIPELGFLVHCDSLLDFPKQDLYFEMLELLPGRLEHMSLLFKDDEHYHDPGILDKASCLWRFSSDCICSMSYLKTLCIKAKRPMSLPNLADAFTRAGITLRTEESHWR